MDRRGPPFTTKVQVRKHILLEDDLDGPSIQLRLSQMNVKDTDMPAIVEALKEANNVVSLDLSGNQIGPRGARLLADALTHCDSIKYVRLDENHIGDVGACTLGAALKNVKRLLELDVEKNGFTDLGFTALFEGLKDCPTLYGLRTGRNHTHLTKETEMSLRDISELDYDARVSLAEARRQSSESQPSRNRHDVDDNGSLFLELLETWTGSLPALSTCPVCLKVYAPNETVLLSTCLHAMCVACATDELQRERTLTCAICQAKTTPASLDPAALPRHPLLEAMFLRHRCGECTSDVADTDTDAVVMCTECNHALCSFHRDGHTRSKTLRRHLLTALPSPADEGGCADHPAESVTHYCQSCSRTVCAACAGAAHADHAAIKLSPGFVRDARQRLAAAVAAAKVFTVAEVHRAVEFHHVSRRINERDAAVVERLNAGFDALANLVESCRQAQLQQLTEFGNAELAEVRESEAEVTKRWHVNMATIAIAEQLASEQRGASAAVLLAQLELPVMARLIEILATVPSPSIRSPHQLQLSLNLETVQDAINGMCHLTP